MASIIGRSARRWRVAILALALLAANAVVLVGSATKAEAVTCNPSVHQILVEHPGFNPVVRATWDFAPQCSDGNARIWGTIYDTSCDNRAAQLTYWIADKLPNGTYTLMSGSPTTHSVPNGCGTNATFNDLRTSPGALGWKLRVRIRACSWGNVNCSSSATLDYYG